MASTRSDVPDFIRTQSGYPLFVQTISATTTAAVTGLWRITLDQGPQGVQVPIEPTQLLVIQPATDCYVRLLGGGTAYATGTVTYAADSGAQTIVIGGVTVALVSGSTPTLTAAAAVVAIQNSLLASAFVTATSALGVVTLTAKAIGVGGNGITLTVTGTGATASGATLASGAGPTAGTSASNAILIGAGQQYWVYKQPIGVHLDLKCASSNGAVNVFAVE